MSGNGSGNDGYVSFYHGESPLDEALRKYRGSPAQRNPDNYHLDQLVRVMVHHIRELEERVTALEDRK